MWGIGIHAVLNLHADNEGESGENKTGRILPYIQYALIVTDCWIVLWPSYPVQNNHSKYGGFYFFVSFSDLIWIQWWKIFFKIFFLNFGYAMCVDF